MSVKLILASASPRRLDLLRQAGVEPEIKVAEVAELTNELPPADLVQANARLKAETVAALQPQSAAEAGAVADDGADICIVAADTVVALQQGDCWRIFGKPADAAEACRMLQALSGREHSVFTGVAVWRQGRLQSGVAESRVRFCKLEAAEIAAYVAGGEPLDKAGAYAIQGGARRFVQELVGDEDNIIGLPLRLLAEMLPAGALPGYSTK